MIYSLHIQDQDTVTPLPGSSLRFVSPTGGTLATITMDADGSTGIDDESDDELLASGVQVVAQAPGYYSFPVFANRISPDFTFGLQKKPNYLPYIIGSLAAGGLLIAALPRKGKKVGGFFDGMSTAAKLGLVGAAGIAAYLIFRGDPNRSKLPEGAATDLDGLAKQGTYPTITPTQAEAFSSELAQAFAGAGTDEDAIYRVFSQLKTKADVLLLITTYGVRSYQGFFEGMIWEENVTSNLATALASELSASDLSHVNSILSGNNIDFAF